MNKLLIQSWVTICIILLIIGVGTYAFFNDSEKTINTITTGVIDLEINGENPVSGPLIVIEDLKPCCWRYKNITLHLVEGSNPARIWMHIFNVTDHDDGGYYDNYCENSKKPCKLTMKYTAKNSSACNHHQDPSKVTCNTYIDPLPSNVYIITTDKNNPADKKAKIWFEGNVSLNETFEIDATNAGKTKLGADTYVFIYTDHSLTTLVQEVKFHTSCSQPLYYGDQFGSLKLVGFTPESKCGCCGGGNNYDISNYIEIDLKLINTSSNETFIIIDEKQHKTLRDLECQWINITGTQWITSGHYAIWANNTTASRTFWSTGSHHEINGIIHSNNEIRVTGSHTAFYGGTHYVSTITITGSHHIFNPSPEQVTVKPLPITYNIDDYKPGGAIATQADAEGKYHYIDGDFHISGSHETLDGLYYVTGNVHLSGSSLTGNYTIVAEGTIRVSGAHYTSTPYAGNLLYFSNSTDSRAIDISGSHHDIKGVYYAPKGGIEITGSHHTMLGSIIGDTVKIAGSHFYLTGLIPVTTQQISIPYLQPCINYTLQFSIHLKDDIGCEYEGAYSTFNIEFYAQQIDGPGIGG
jgi:predicted ribosomally synthesized peptide with SipW-like signal peptide